MPYYLRLGSIPSKRHVQFRKPDGGLYAEELFSSEGFSGPQSILYHHRHPTQVRKAWKIADTRPAYVEFGPLRQRHLKTLTIAPAGDAVSGRIVLLGNDDLTISVCRPAKPMDYFYRNGQNDELIFVHEGQGVLHTIFGRLDFRAGDYLIIPISTTWRMELAGGPHRLLVVESASPIRTPRRYRNHYGQLLEHSPYCERDFRVPAVLETHDEPGDFEVRIKARDGLHGNILDHHPFDVVGWDGCVYPWAFNIEDFEPITGRIHQPPPVHQTFEARNYVVCSFVPRLFDYHPQAVPIPYAHANIHSDEVLYYVRGNFMSRRGIEEASLTLHTAGLPHGPHPGLTEKSLGAVRTEELAVMIDTFRPLQVTRAALDLEDPDYAWSWSTPLK